MAYLNLKEFWPFFPFLFSLSTVAKVMNLSDKTMPYGDFILFPDPRVPFKNRVLVVLPV